MRSFALLTLAACAAGLAVAQNCTAPLGYQDTPMLPGQPWHVHDDRRPHPKLVTPANTPGQPPADAIVLFDGKDLSHWAQSGADGKLVPPAWKLEDGHVEVGQGGSMFTREKFGDVQLHIEWAAPSEVVGTSQCRGNSGIIIMSRYEIQVLDSIDNPTYADGQAGAIYGQWPPLVNPARPRGQWQAYDIFFEAPRFEGGKLAKPGYVTVVFNGVLVQHHQRIIGRMTHREVGTYAPHDPEEPLLLQDHGTKVRYRNIWVRRLKGYDQPE